MKKMMCLMMVFVLLALCTPALADEGAWAYDAANQYLVLNGEFSGDVEIPSEVDGQPVKALCYSLFSGQNNITALRMPDTLETLGNGSVGGMGSLSSVTLSPNLTIIESNNFSNCPALTSITVPASVKFVCDSFYMCGNLREIRFEGVCPVFFNSGWCFESLPDDCVIYVPDDQFDAYRAAVGNEDGAADKMRPSGQNAVVQERATPDGDFSFDAATGTITGYAGSSAYVDIPAFIGGVSVKTIGVSAFETYTLYYVTIPEGVEAIAEGAFAHASNLCVVEFPSTLKMIGAEAFYNAQAKVIKWSEGLVEIGARAFMYDYEQSVALPSTVKTVGESAFEGAQLQELYLSGQMEAIGARAFAGTPLSYMAFDFYAPIEIAGDAFADTHVADLDLPWDSSFENRDAYAALMASQCPDCTVWINNPASGGVAETPENTPDITKIENGVWTAYNGDAANLTVWTVYDQIEVTALGDGLFKGNQAIRSFYPHHCGWFTTIGAEAFADSSVEYVELFGSITTIGNGAFRNCANMTELTLPASLTEIGEDSLEGCTGLTKLTVLCDPAILPEGLLRDCAALTEIYAASDATDEQVQVLSARANRPWYLPAARLGEEMPSLIVMPYEPLPGDDFWYDEEFSRLDQYNGSEVNLVLPREIDDIELTMIGGTMMSRASYGDDFEMELPVRSVVIPETYKKLTDYGFANCETIETVVFYAPIEDLPDGFFSGCVNLRNVIFVNGVRNIGRDVFAGCSNLEILYLGEHVESVDEFAFRDEDRGDVFSLDRCILSPDQMPDVEALLTAAAGAPISAPETTPEPNPIEAAPIGAEGEAFFGMWYGTSMEMDGETYNLADFGLTMTLTLNADGTVELSTDGEPDAAVWAIVDGVATIDGAALTLMENGDLCMAGDGEKMLFSRQPASAQPVAVGDEGEAFVGAWRSTTMEMDGETYALSEMGMDMSITLNADGTAQMQDGEETKNIVWSLTDGAVTLGSTKLMPTDDGRLYMEEDGAKIIFEREAAGSNARAFVENNSGDFIGMWYAVTMEEDGEIYDMAELGMGMWINLHADGTAEVFADEELYTWTFADGVVYIGDIELVPTGDSRLYIEDENAIIFFEREAKGSNVHVKSPEEAPPFDLSARLEKKYVMVSADVQGMNMTSAMLGGYEYSIILHEDGTMDFVMAGAAVPGLTWTRGIAVVDDVEMDAIIIDYYGTPLNIIITEDGFDMNYFDSMMIHLVAEDVAKE